MGWNDLLQNNNGMIKNVDCTIQFYYTLFFLKPHCFVVHLFLEDYSFQCFTVPRKQQIFHINAIFLVIPSKCIIKAEGVVCGKKITV